MRSFRRSMIELAARQVRIFLPFAGRDVGLMPLHLGSRGAELSAIPGTLVLIEPSLDHDLTRSDMQQGAADRIIDFLYQVRSAQDHGADALR